MFPVDIWHSASVRQISNHRFSLIRDNRVAAEIGEIAFQASDILTIGLANGTKFRHRSHRPQRSCRPDAKLTIGIADALASGIEHRDKSA